MDDEELLTYRDKNILICYDRQGEIHGGFKGVHYLTEAEFDIEMNFVKNELQKKLAHARSLKERME